MNYVFRIIALIVILLIAAGMFSGAAHAKDFDFYGVKFGMSKEEVEEAINKKMCPYYPTRKKLFKSMGGEWGHYHVDSPGHKILSIYFKFDNKGSLNWMKVNYPYSLTSPAKIRPLLNAIKREFAEPIKQRHKDVEVKLDEKRMRMTLIYKPPPN